MRYIERCLWDYRDNLASIEMMREELAGLMSVHGQELGKNGANEVSDPVPKVCERVMMLERNIKKVEKMTLPITRMLEGLCGSELRVKQMNEVLRLKYFEHESTNVVIRKAGISATTYFRRIGEIKRLARKYFGEWA